MSEEQTSSAQVDAQTQDQATPAETGEPAAEQKPVMIPKERFDQVNARLKAAEAAAKELEALKQAQADEQAKKTGDIERFTKERDQFKSEAEQWRAYATDKLAGIAEQLDDAGRTILDDLGDEVPLNKRLAIAEKLLSAAGKKQPSGFGTTGGSAPAETAGLIPPQARTSRAAYEQWLADLTSSGDPAAMSVLIDSRKREQLEQEARKLFGR